MMNKAKIIPNNLHITFSQHPSPNLPFDMGNNSFFNQSEECYNEKGHSFVSKGSTLSPLSIACIGKISDFYHAHPLWTNEQHHPSMLGDQQQNKQPLKLSISFG
jgi:hypothetical protein